VAFFISILIGVYFNVEIELSTSVSFTLFKRLIVTLLYLLHFATA